MNLPLQSPPVSRQASTHHYSAGQIAGSGIACTLCHVGCNALPEPARTVCNLACDHTVC